MTRDHARVAVVICAYTEERWGDLVAAHNSLRAQTRAPDEIVVVIDHNDALLDRARSQFAGAAVVPNSGARGLSDARNTGIKASTADIVLFLDDDACAAPDWVERLVGAFADTDVMGVGGWAVPRWEEPGRPSWFPEPFLWVVGCSYEGLPTVRAAVRNPIGCAMGFRRDALERVGGFSGGIGRVGSHPVGCEETELAIRVRQAVPGAVMLHEPAAVVQHRVTAARRRPSYFFRRCYWEGYSKAVISSTVGHQDALSSERAYVARVLPRAVVSGVAGFARSGNVAHLLRAGAVLAGLGATASGYARGRMVAR